MEKFNEVTAIHSSRGIRFNYQWRGTDSEKSQLEMNYSGK